MSTGKTERGGTAEKGLDVRFLFAYDAGASLLSSAKETTIMTIGKSMLGEFDQEMAGTRKTLERLPEQKWNWKPHDKSGTVGWLAGHIAMKHRANKATARTTAVVIAYDGIFDVAV